jgi:regulator of sigma E protease
MFYVLISAVKIIFLLGFLVFIHEGGHFLVAKLCNVKVNEFSIGFGKILWKRQGKETKYAIRLMPLGGFVSMEGENETSENKRAFSNASILRRIAIVSAGAVVNILFGIIVYFILVITVGLQFADPSMDTFLNRLHYGGLQTWEFIKQLVENVKMIFTGNVSINQMTGPVGISQIVSTTSGIVNYIYIMAVISISLGITNLLPIPALDGGKIVLLLIEAIRRKPLKMETEAIIQLVGFALIMFVAIFVTYNDIARIF